MNRVVGQSETSIEASINEGEHQMPSDNRTGFWRGLTATLGLAATAAIPGQAQAQVSNASAVPDLEEIVVTARRREESLVDVPVSVTVMNSDFIERNNILDTHGLYAETPGVDYLEIGGRINARTTIRGVTPASQGALRQKSTVLVDGVPIVGSNGSIQFVDLERVEVLRGPQSAAFGRATFAGAINYVTRDPGDELSGKFQATYSDQNRAILGASFDGPITETLGFTLDVFEEDFDGPDGWITTDGYKVGATNTQHFSAKLKFTPNDFFDMELTASYTEQDDGKVADYKIPGGGAELQQRRVGQDRSCPGRLGLPAVYDGIPRRDDADLSRSHCGWIHRGEPVTTTWHCRSAYSIRQTIGNAKESPVSSISISTMALCCRR